MIKRPQLLTLLALAALFSASLLAACAGAALPTPPNPSPAQPTLPAITDGLGRPVHLPAPAQRIVSLAPSNTEILFALGAGSQVVGRDEFSDYPTEAQTIPSVGGSFGKFSTEAIVNLKPDLVLAAETIPADLVQSLQDLGLTIFWLANPKDFDGLWTNLNLVGQMAGRQAEAQTLVSALQKRVAAVDDKVKAAAERPLVFYELDATDPNAPYTAGPGTFVEVLIERAGGRNAGSSLASAWAALSAEALLVQNPDIILLGDAAYGITPESVAGRAGWSEMKAVRDGKIYAFDDNLASRPGPRLVDGLEAMAKLIHPELFE